MTYASLFSDTIVAMAKRDHEVYGDEIALTLLGLPCKQFYEKYKTKDFCIWMFSEEDKKRIVDDVFTLFFEKFGFYPKSTGSYYLDAFTINYIKAKYPSIECAIATCWEEGAKAYHTTNNSWYTFIDGGPWAPWIPSKVNSAIPAANQDDDAGLVCIPHLSRDLIACYDGNGSNFGTHPQNVLRGMFINGIRGGVAIPPSGFLGKLFNNRFLVIANESVAVALHKVGGGFDITGLFGIGFNQIGEWLGASVNASFFVDNRIFEFAALYEGGVLGFLGLFVMLVFAIMVFDEPRPFLLRIEMGEEKGFDSRYRRIT